ncbi:MAG: hypothetical protein D6771_09210, partial [Zetaproteobacteria bacterium]
AEAAFVPSLNGALASPTALWLYHDDLAKLLGQGEGVAAVVEVGGETRALCAPEWQRAGRRVLQDYGAKGLSDEGHLRAMARFRPAHAEAAVGAMKLVAGIRDDIPWYRGEAREEAWEIIESMPLWLCRDGHWRPLRADAPLLERLPRGLDGIEMPAWCRFHLLDAAFLKVVDERAHEEKKAFLDGDDAKDAFIRGVMLHALRRHEEDEEWWREYGLGALRVLLALGLSAENEHVRENERRKALAECVRVPVRGGGWRPACATYASKAWYEAHETPWGEALAKLDGRFALAGREAFGKLGSDERLPGLLRYLGVSWLPKIEKYESEWTYWREPNPFAGAAPDASMVEQWREYLDDRSEEWHAGDGYYRACTWAIEGLSAIEALDAAHADCLMLLRDVFNELKVRKLGRSTKIERRGPRGGRREKAIPRVDFPLWQIKRARIFTVDRRSSILADCERLPARDLFLEDGKGWKSWLPCLDLGACADENERDRLRVFASEVLETPRHVKEARDELWWRWLSQLQDGWESWDETQRRKQAEHLAQFFADLTDALAGKEERAAPPEEVRVPAETREGIAFVEPGRAYILDDHKWEPLRETLVRQGHPIMLVSLATGRKAARLFGCRDRLLSEALEVGIDDESVKRARRFGVKALLGGDFAAACTLAL